MTPFSLLLKKSSKFRYIEGPRKIQNIGKLLKITKYNNNNNNKNQSIRYNWHGTPQSEILLILTTTRTSELHKQQINTKYYTRSSHVSLINFARIHNILFCSTYSILILSENLDSASAGKCKGNAYVTSKMSH